MLMTVAHADGTHRVGNLPSEVSLLAYCVAEGEIEPRVASTGTAPVSVSV